MATITTSNTGAHEDHLNSFHLVQTESLDLYQTARLALATPEQKWSAILQAVFTSIRRIQIESTFQRGSQPLWRHLGKSSTQMNSHINQA